MCNCVHNDNGMGALAAAYGLRGLTDPVHVGAPFSLGVELMGLWYANDLFFDAESLRKALIASGYVLGNVQVYQKAGIVNPYIVIEGQSGREYGSATHLRDAVLSIVQASYHIDAGTIGYEVQTYNAQTQAQTVARYDAAAGSATQAPGTSAAGAVSGIVDKIATSFGVTQSQALLIGAGGAIVGVILLKRLI